MISDADVRYWESEREKIESEPEYFEKNYEDVTEDFLPPRVDALQGNIKLNKLSPSEFKQRYEKLTDDEQKIFLEFISHQTRATA
jgi:hypothetical protein